jgi:hypothetical protein
MPTKRARPLIPAVIALALGWGTPEAAEFLLKDGQVVRGEIVLATRNTITLGQGIGAVRQVPLTSLERVSVRTSAGSKLEGAFAGWRNGALGLSLRDEVVWIEDGSVRSRQPRAVEVAEPAAGRTGTQPAAEPEPAKAPAAAAQIRRAVAPARPAEPVVVRAELTSARVSEGDGEAVIGLQLSRSDTAPLRVRYTMIDGDAVAGSDYVDAPGEITIPPGTRAALIRTKLVDDDEAEREEVFYVVFSAETRFERGWLPIAIGDDDAEPADR